MAEPEVLVQIKLLRLLAVLGAGDKSASDNMYAMIGETLKRANTGHTIGNAIIFECVRTITSIYPNPGLLHAGAPDIPLAGTSQVFAVAWNISQLWFCICGGSARPAVQPSVPSIINSLQFSRQQSTQTDQQVCRCRLRPHLVSIVLHRFV